MDARSKAEAETIRHNAIMRLSAARREKLAKEDFDVYCDGLAEFEPRIVAMVCRQLEREEPGEYEPRFPILPAIFGRCARQRSHEAEQKQQKLEAAKVLPPHISEGPNAERWANFQADVARELQRKRMR